MSRDLINVKEEISKSMHSGANFVRIPFLNDGGLDFINVLTQKGAGVISGMDDYSKFQNHSYILKNFLETVRANLSVNDQVIMYELRNIKEFLDAENE